jgi:UDP:flavonoid glycosyltransferase YjiC (YdhE family)
MERVAGKAKLMLRRARTSLILPRLKLNDTVYLFVATNGAGLGHLTRCLAVAKQLGQIEPDAQIIFYSTSIGVPIVHQFGFASYHLPPADLLLKEGVGARRWNEVYAEQLITIMKLHRPATIVFDGSFPYAGLRVVAAEYPQAKWVWIHRGLNKANPRVSKRLASFVDLFDLIIEPGEVGRRENASEAKHQKVGPIVLLEPTDILPRHEAMRALKLDINRPAAYVQLGAGNINSIDDIQIDVVRALKEIPHMQVVVGRSPISSSWRSTELADQTLVGYPNARFFAAFDIGVMAAGYNSVCEAYAFGLPTIFIPNVDTSSDDQVLRAERISAIDARWSILNGWSRDEFLKRLEQILQLERSARRGVGSDGVDGARTAASWISLPGSGRQPKR